MANDQPVADYQGGQAVARTIGTLLLTALLFAALSAFLLFRRGYYDLFIANKVFAGVAAMLFGLIVVIGPLSRAFPSIQKLSPLRKELGIIAFLLVLVHTVVSLFFLPSHFPRSWYASNLWPFVFGLGALVVLAVLFVLSNKAAVKRLRQGTWRILQSWGMRLAFLLILLHVAVMKIPSWLSWYQKGGGKELVHPEWPGAGLLVGWFLAFMFFVRIASMFDEKVTKFAWYFTLVALPAVYILTFWWGAQVVD